MKTQSVLIVLCCNIIFVGLSSIASDLPQAKAANKKQLALSFDDIPAVGTSHFGSIQRTKALIQNLRALNVPETMIFANPCLGESEGKSVNQIRLYFEAGHRIANHTCTHPRFSAVELDHYIKDAARAATLLSPFYQGQKFFRFPFLDEGVRDRKRRDKFRVWLGENGYRNGYVSLDNDDYMYSDEVNKALAANPGLKVNYERIEQLFLKHMLSAIDFYTDLAFETLGRHPKHVLLLHERDLTVKFISSLVKSLRDSGWEFIPASEAYKDSVYFSQPSNLYSNNGIIGQVHFETTGKVKAHNDYGRARDELRRELGIIR